jgi:hypothetical protein
MDIDDGKSDDYSNVEWVGKKNQMIQQVGELPFTYDFSQLKKYKNERELGYHLYMMIQKYNNPMLQLLLNNFLGSINYSPKYLIGPYIVQKFILNDKTIVMLGESHMEYKFDETNDALRVANFLDYTLRTTQKPIDVFLEAPPNPLDDFGNVDYSNPEISKFDIEWVRKKFYKCYGKQKTCEYNGGRIHWTDLRLADEEMFPVEDLEKISTRDEFIVYFQKELTKMKKYFVNLTDKHLPKLRDQFKSSSQILKNELERNIRDFLIFSHDLANDIIKSIYEKRPSNEDIKRLQDKAYDFVDKELFILDFYVLGRMLRTFHYSSDIYSGPCKNIIFYGGSQHVENIGRLITNVGGHLTKTYHTQMIGDHRGATLIDNLFD